MVTRSIQFTGAVFLLGLCAPLGTALAQSTPPPVGARYDFSCNSSIRSNYTETYEVVSVSGSSLRIQVNDGTATNSFEKPVHLLNTTLYERQSLFGRQSSFSSVPAEFKRLSDLSVGTKVKAWATEVRNGPHERLEWSYTVSVVGQDTLYVPDMGDLNVISVAESRWVDRYSANLTSYYSPDLMFPVYWRYTDSNIAEVECTLASASGVEGFVATAAPQQAATPTTGAYSVAVAQATGVRRFASQEAPLVAMVPANESVDIIGQIENGGVLWYQVSLSGGVEGFLPESAISGQGTTRSVAITQQAAVPQTSAAVEAQQAAPADDAASRLARLNQLHSAGLISDEEYEVKKREISGPSQPTGVADQLRAANDQFRSGALSADQFVARRAAILEGISPKAMGVEDGLVLIDALLSAQLISPTEHRRKRNQMLTAL